MTCRTIAATAGVAATPTAAMALVSVIGASDEAAVERASRFIEVGADVTFVEAPETLDDLKAVPHRLKAPQMLNMVLGGKTPIIDRAAAAEMGFSIVLYANAALQGAVQGMQTTLAALKTGGILSEGAVTSFAERQRLVDKPAYDAMEERYAAKAFD